MYFEDLNLSMTMRLVKITISGQALYNLHKPNTHTFTLEERPLDSAALFTCLDQDDVVILKASDCQK